MFSNSAGSVRRPLTFTVYWNCVPALAGGWPTCPAGATRFCSPITLARSVPVRPEFGQFVGPDPEAHGIVALADDHRGADARECGRSGPPG